MGAKVEREGTAVDWRTSYLRHRQLLFGALAKLARTGLVVPPDESLDLIQSFFAEVWPGLEARFDPKRARFETYLYGAFLRFARPRIQALVTWRSRLVDAVELHAVAQQGSADAAASQDVERVRNAIAALPELERAVLLGLVEDGETERALARRLGHSRHRIRSALVDALGRVALAVAERDDTSEIDWRVARTLWVEGLPPPAAAARLGISGAALQQARARLFQRFSKGLDLRHAERVARNESEGTTMDPLQLLDRTLASPGNEKLLGELAKRSVEVLEALEKAPESFELEDVKTAKQDAAWLGRVYEALALPPEGGAEEDESVRAQLAAKADDEASVGAAFRDALLPGLPPQLQALDEWLAKAGCARLPKESYEWLLATPAVQAGLGATEGPARYGVSPLTVLGATNAVSGLARRLARRGRLPEVGSFELEPRRGAYAEVDRPHLAYESLIEGIYEVSGGTREIAEVLYGWLLEVGAHRPLLFRDLEAEPTPDGALRVEMRRDDERDLYQRWGAVGALAVDAAGGAEDAGQTGKGPAS